MFVAVGAMLACAEPAFALIIASDDASQAAYNPTWESGDNGGSGFTAWNSVTTGLSNAGTFVGTSNGDIGTGGSQKVWGLYSNNSTQTGAAVRPFSSALVPGWVFSIDMDNGNVGNGGTVG